MTFRSLFAYLRIAPSWAFYARLTTVSPVWSNATMSVKRKVRYTSTSRNTVYGAERVEVDATREFTNDATAEEWLRLMNAGEDCWVIAFVHDIPVQTSWDLEKM